jgi:hypothetical protein
VERCSKCSDGLTNPGINKKIINIGRCLELKFPNRLILATDSKFLINHLLNDPYYWNFLRAYRVY